MTKLKTVTYTIRSNVPYLSVEFTNRVMHHIRFRLEERLMDHLIDRPSVQDVVVVSSRINTAPKKLTPGQR